MKLPPLFVVLRRIGDSAPEIVDMFRFRLNAVSEQTHHRKQLKARGLKALVWIERYELARKRRRR